MCVCHELTSSFATSPEAPPCEGPPCMAPEKAHGLRLMVEMSQFTLFQSTCIPSQLCQQGPAMQEHLSAFKHSGPACMLGRSGPGKRRRGEAPCPSWGLRQGRRCQQSWGSRPTRRGGGWGCGGHHWHLPDCSGTLPCLPSWRCHLTAAHKHLMSGQVSRRCAVECCR